MYEYHNNKLSIPARFLYEDWGLMTISNYFKSCSRGKLVRTKEGKGEGNEAWVSFYDLPKPIKEFAQSKLGDPKKVVVRNKLEEYIVPDSAAAKFFAEHRKPNGRNLSIEDQREKATNAMILNAIKVVLSDVNIQKKVFGSKKLKIWENLSEAVNHLDSIGEDDKDFNTTSGIGKKWLFSLPGNPRRLKSKYDSYISNGYSEFLHKGEGKKNAQKIKGDVADFILGQYALPTKIKIPELVERYEMEAQNHEDWGTLTESAVYNWLYQPEQERIWILGRHGKDAYNKKFKHTITRDKSDWFPNVYWSIDGTKLDWIHFWDDSTNKMGAKLKIDVVFDVFSEKIIGSSLGFSENHIEHFRAVKEAVNTAECRPYYITYDHQSGHIGDRMQTLYDSLIANEKGTHHANKVRNTHGPAEQLFARLQDQVINRFWFSDGQSVTVRRDDNKMNFDFINKNKKLLKTTSELKQAWETVVNIWNDKKHPHFKMSRNEVYEMEMPMREELSYFEIVDKMWLQEAKRPITYTKDGLRMSVDGDDKYFEVYDIDNRIDTEFRRVNVGRKFIVRFDPDYMDEYIQLFQKDESGNTLFVANAQPKHKHQNVPALMKEGEKDFWQKDYDVIKEEYNRDYQAYQDLMQRSGITPEKEMDDQELLIKHKGSLTKVQREKVEAQENLYDF